MSEKEIIQEINEIFLHLTDQEPTPDEEIEAREQLIEKFDILKSLNSFPLHVHLIEEILDILNNWDTLDLWFKEVEGLAQNIGKFLKLTGMKKGRVQIERFDKIKEEIEENIGTEVDSNLLDITQIVSEVTEKFKGEITTLKDTIEHLKKELEGKEERIQDIAQKKPVKVIVPKKESKLAPPTIKIPSIKRPEKPPHIKVKIDSEVEESEMFIEPMEEDFEALKFEAKEETEEIPEITEESLNEQIETADSFDKPKLTPVISEIPRSDSKSQFPFKLAQIPREEDEIVEEGVELTPLPPEKPKIMRISEEDDLLTPLPAEKPRVMDWEEEDSTLTQEASKTEVSFEQEPQLTPIPAEEKLETEKGEEPTFLTPVISKKPKITPISIEEIDTETIKSSGTDLFNVFSSVGKRASEQKVEPQKTIGKTEPLKETHLKPDKKGISEFIPQKMETVPQSKPKPLEPEISVEALPKDKDSLYQELIALEGRRYSLEKGYKDLSGNYQNGIIDEFEFNSRSEGLKNQLDEISSRITKIRRIIASL
ncbi:MAG: hypothetical protein EU532_05905 [Promethearchaeota archaeon]|nr:MAG: hypothetical protein EU532_05905 [Candidatus Lokiarchaeota archaeon]